MLGRSIGCLAISAVLFFGLSFDLFPFFSVFVNSYMGSSLIFLSV